jgi:hypothetical protein
MSKKLFISFASVLATAAFVVVPTAAQAAVGSPHYYKGEAATTIAKENVQVPAAAFGTLTLKNTAGGTGASLTCHNVVGGFVENPKGSGTETGHSGPAGIGETQSFNPYACTSAACTAATTGGGPATYLSVAAEPTPYKSPAEPGGTATNLAWKSTLKTDTTAKRSETTIRSITAYSKVNVHCHVETGANPETGEPIFGVVTNEVSEGSNQPWTGPFEGVKSLAAPQKYPETVFDNPSEENGEGSGELHGPAGEETRKGKTEGSLDSVAYQEWGVLIAKPG